MPLKSIRDLVGPQDSPSTEVTYVGPSTDVPVTLDLLAAVVRAQPDLTAKHDRLCYERERVDLGDGLVLVTAVCFPTKGAA